MSDRALQAVDAILFDLGGTVLEIRHEVLKGILARHGVEPPRGWEPTAERAGRRAMEAALAASAPPRDAWRAMFEGMMTSAGADAAIAAQAFPEVDAYHRAHHLWNRALPGMPLALRTLATRGYRVAAVSNSDGRAEQILKGLGLLDCFEVVIDSHEVGVEKPAARIFHLACERLELAPAQCAYVGDVVAIDVEGARGAGLKPVLFDAYGSYDAKPGNGTRVTSATELLGLFPGRAQAPA